MDSSGRRRKLNGIVPICRTYGWAFGSGISGFGYFGFPKMIPEISWGKEKPENSGSGSGLPELPDFLTLHICNTAERRRRLGDGAPRQETGSARAPRGGGLARDAETGRGGVGGGSASDAPTRRPAGAGAGSSVARPATRRRGDRRGRGCAAAGRPAVAQTRALGPCLLIWRRDGEDWRERDGEMVGR